MPTKTNRLQRIDGAYHFDFRPTSDYRQAQTSPGQRKIAKVADFLSDHRAVKKDHSVQLLILDGARRPGRDQLPAKKAFARGERRQTGESRMYSVGWSSFAPRIPAVRQWFPQAGAAGGVNGATPRRVV